MPVAVLGGGGRRTAESASTSRASRASSISFPSDTSLCLFIGPPVVSSVVGRPPCPASGSMATCPSGGNIANLRTETVRPWRACTAYRRDVLGISTINVGQARCCLCGGCSKKDAVNWNEAFDVGDSVPRRVRRLTDADADQSILVLLDVVRAEAAQCLASNVSFVEFALQIVPRMNLNGAA